MKLAVNIGKKLSSKRTQQGGADRQGPKKEAAKLQKKGAAQEYDDSAWTINELGERSYAVLGGQTSSDGTRSKDHGDMMHRLAHHDSFDSLLDKPHMRDQLRDPYFSSKTHYTPNVVSEKDELRIALLPNELWERIALFLEPLDAAHLAISSKTLYRKLGLTPFTTLDQLENKHLKIAFLNQFDHQLPGHLLCFPCATYHRRSHTGKEVLKADYVSHPVFVCPKVTSSVLPRLRLAHGRELPYAYVQLAMRHAKYSPNHGISPDGLTRRWKSKGSGWQHCTRYMEHDGRLLMRAISKSFAPPTSALTETAQRHILYDREHYMPYFSVCAHWRDGDLMKICKCMMSHLPEPPDSYYRQLQRGPKLSRAAAHPNLIVRGCNFCGPARRCPECPTEYLVELQMGEDTNDPVAPFKHAIVVTRWSDLGDGSSPYTSPEWVAVSGNMIDSRSEYDSFSNLGRRAVGGVFESRISGSVPGQRLVSLNPKNKKLGMLQYDETLGAYAN